MKVSEYAIPFSSYKDSFCFVIKSYLLYDFYTYDRYGITGYGVSRPGIQN
jgi:hypothetical protein